MIASSSFLYSFAFLTRASFWCSISTVDSLLCSLSIVAFHLEIALSSENHISRPKLVLSDQSFFVLATC